MPTYRKMFKRHQPAYGWVTGGMGGLKQEAIIASGNFGDVHKVTAPFPLLILQMVNEVTRQIFARKVVRVLDQNIIKDFEAAVRALAELCRPELSNTVVEFLKHGWLPRQGSDLYYIDMEYCPETLESR